MAHNIEARYDEREHLFLPPLRTLGFNPQLNINDSLLVQSYIEAYDISYPEALQRIDDEVEELKQHLENEGSYELNDIGLLTLNEDGNYVFTPCEAGILTPSLYGLCSVEMKPLMEQEADRPEPETQEEEAGEPVAQIIPIETETSDEEEEDDVIRIKYTWVRNAVAVAAILLAVFILALPTGKTDMMQRTISNINNGLLFGMTSKDTNTSKIDIKSDDVSRNVKCGMQNENTTSASMAKADSLTKSDSASSTNLIPHSCVPSVASEQSSSATFHIPQDSYCIVLASHVSMRNANSFIERLQKQGYDQAEIFVRNNITRVIYGHYPTEEAAHDDLRRFHRQSETAEAWLMKLQ